MDLLCTSLFLLKHGHLMAAAQPYCCICSQQWETRSSTYSTRGTCRPSPYVGCGMGPAGHRVPMLTVEADLVLTVLSVSKASFHPVPLWVVSSLVTLTPETTNFKYLTISAFQLKYLDYLHLISDMIQVLVYHAICFLFVSSFFLLSFGIVEQFL